jgi:hypothetical protein
MSATIQIGTTTPREIGVKEFFIMMVCGGILSVVKNNAMLEFMEFLPVNGRLKSGPVKIEQMAEFFLPVAPVTAAAGPKSYFTGVNLIG